MRDDDTVTACGERCRALVRGAAAIALDYVQALSEGSSLVKEPENVGRATCINAIL
jgi:hypothetical protein